MVVVMVAMILVLKPAMYRLSVMNPLDDKLNANLDCAVVAMLLYILCWNFEG